MTPLTPPPAPTPSPDCIDLKGGGRHRLKCGVWSRGPASCSNLGSDALPTSASILFRLSELHF